MALSAIDLARDVQRMESIMERIFLVLAGLFGALAVAFGAFGAHALADRLPPDLLRTYETGVRYHFYHSLALIAVVVVIGRRTTSNLPVVAGWLFVAGIAVFSGSLYALAISGVRVLGAITPIGGMAFIAGWVCLTWAAWRA